MKIEYSRFDDIQLENKVYSGAAVVEVGNDSTSVGVRVMIPGIDADAVVDTSGNTETGFA